MELWMQIVLGVTVWFMAALAIVTLWYHCHKSIRDLVQHMSGMDFFVFIITAIAPLVFPFWCVVMFTAFVCTKLKIGR